MRYKQHTVSKLEAQSTKLRTLQRAIKYLEKLENDEIDKKEILPKYISYYEARRSYAVQIRRANRPTLRNAFQDPHKSKENLKQEAIDQLDRWKLEHNIT